MIRSAATGMLTLGTLAFGALALPEPASADPAYDALVAKHAAANGVPESLIRRVIVRESGYRPGLVSKGNYGLMQIKPATARSMGYTGSPQGLLDADTNMTYAVKYLAGAYRVAGGNHDRAVSNYARGYYYAAKRQGLNIVTATSAPVAVPVAVAEVEPAAQVVRKPPATFPNIFALASAQPEGEAQAVAATAAEPVANDMPAIEPKRMTAKERRALAKEQRNMTAQDRAIVTERRAAANNKPVVLRPDSATAFAAVETPRKQRRQKVEKPLNLLQMFEPQPKGKH